MGRTKEGIYWRPFIMAGGPLLLGIPVYLAQRSHLSDPAPVPPYQRPGRVSP